MNLHEYQAKILLKSFGIKVPMGIVALTPEEAIIAAKKIGSSAWIIKAQIHAGGRGQGGGIKIAKSLDEVRKKSEQMLGMRLITPQTPKEGKLVRRIMVAQDIYLGIFHPKEYYFSILMNRDTGYNIIVYSTEGGMNIEHVAKRTPEKIFTESINPIFGLRSFQVRKMAFNLELSGSSFKAFTSFITDLYRGYVESDACLVEINPVLKTLDDKIIAVDAKMILDDNALYRHPEYAIMHDVDEQDPIEVEANKIGLSFVKLCGNVGCMVNGAGLAMATMDIIKIFGGSPANFLDIGGTANAQRVSQAFQILLKDKSVQVILINIFGGIVRCDDVVQGIMDVYDHMSSDSHIPIIMCLRGTNANHAQYMIAKSGLKFFSAFSLQEAAEKVKETLDEYFI